jgi:hypothetical protein
MFSLTTHQEYFLYQPATDMRKGFNGLSGIIRNELGENPLSGQAFIFINRRRNRMKILVWEHGGFVLFYKILEKGTFQILQSSSKNKSSCSITWHQLVLLIEGIELQSIKKRPRFSLSKTG